MSVILEGQNYPNLQILVVRPDRLGDVILSTPVFDVIKRHYTQAQVTVLAKDNVIPILKGLPSINDFMTFDPSGRHAGIKGFFRLYQEIRARKFRIAVVLQSHWKIAAVLFLARIQYRVGPLSKPHSFFFYNRGVRQRRSDVEMHETDYNLQLLTKLGIRLGARDVDTQVALSDEAQAFARKWFEEKKWNPKKPLIIVHPGMGGSALNWPESHYQELIRNFVESDRQVLVTGGPTESVLLDRFKHALGPLKEKVLFFRAEKDHPVDFLGALFSYASLVVAPSTGPLHLAVALKKPVLTFYPPIRVQSALRWGPYLSDPSGASILVPEVYCGQENRCIGSLCHYFPCMKSLTVKQALRQAESLLS